MSECHCLYEKSASDNAPTQYSKVLLTTKCLSPRHSMIGGRFGSVIGDASDFPFNLADAQTIVQQSLARNNMNATLREDHFHIYYGYYEFHTEQNGTPADLIAVNGYTEQTIYQTWLGPIVNVTETLGGQTSESPWDANGDGRVDILDLTLVGSHFGETIDVDVIPNPDINRDGEVDVLDLILIGPHFGETATAPSAHVQVRLNRQQLKSLQHALDTLETLANPPRGAVIAGIFSARGL